MEYKIAIEELLRRVVTVEAENPTLAVYEVEEEYNLTRHVLSEKDFIGVDIVLAPEDKEAQEYLSNGTLSYTQIDRRTYYQEHDIMRLLGMTGCRRKSRKESER
ncbi:DpnD/PcfM family protein [uncultured Phocaeicola sp.]|uniref:DpnD/PcfM family protein n=1 Tax=uncultured Phocaeicola sp. TaxID=990718 RepID=UPI0025F7A773|nr:DpnD/PcfM family protein [uncultured Phocaeicola sp.]